MSKEPRKTIINPDYVDYQKTKLRKAIDGCYTESFESLLIDPCGLETLFPEDYDKHVGDGAWIMLRKTITVGKEGKTIVLPALSIYFALSTPSTLSTKSGIPRYKVEVQTPDGTVCIWPYEYIIIDLEDYLSFTSEEGFYIHYLSLDPKVEAEKLFYLQSRGIPKSEALLLLLPQMSDSNYCYFTWHPQIVAMFDGVGLPPKHRFIE